MFKLISLLCIAMIMISLSLITNCSTTISQASALFDIASPTANINTNNFLTYQDSTLGIKIDYPAGWTHELHAGSIVTFLASLESHSNTYPAGLGIKVQHLKSKNISLNNITKIQIKNLTQSHSDFKLIESTESKIGGNSGHKIVFTATDNKKNERKAMQIWALRGDKAYLITYKAEPGEYAKYLPLIQKMVDSFQFTRYDSEER
jgi:eukaryotic-like serine/threonine-protein kinase